MGNKGSCRLAAARRATKNDGLSYRALVAMILSCATAWGATVSGRVELTDSKKDASGVVVWLEPLEGAPPNTPPQTVSMAHRNKTFVPHVLAVRTGWEVT